MKITQKIIVMQVNQQYHIDMNINRCKKIVNIDNNYKRFKSYKW